MSNKKGLNKEFYFITATALVLDICFVKLSFIIDKWFHCSNQRKEGNFKSENVSLWFATHYVSHYASEI